MSDLTGSDPGPHTEEPPDGEARGRRPSEGPPAWLRTSALVVGGAMVLIVLFVVANAMLPGWWAHTIGRQVDGVGSAGLLWGLFYGIVFTLLPLAVAFLAIRPTWHWKTRLIVGGVALLLTAPNLLTLAVAAGASADTRAARTVMAIEAPNFRLATLIGVIATLVVGAVAGFLIWRLISSRRELHKLRAESLGTEGKKRRGRSGDSATVADSVESPAGETSTARETPTGRDAPRGGETPRGGEAPADSDMPTDRDTPTENDTLRPRETPPDRDTPGGSELDR